MQRARFAALTAWRGSRPRHRRRGGRSNRDAGVFPLETAVACAPLPFRRAAAATAPHRRRARRDGAGALRPVRPCFIVDGGTSAGVQLGQQFFVRRSEQLRPQARGARAVRHETAGWIRVVAVNESTAIATVDHACGPLLEMDLLVPFVAPVLPANIERDEAPGQPDFTTLRHIVVGNDDRIATGPGDFVLTTRERPGRDRGRAFRGVSRCRRDRPAAGQRR